MFISLELIFSESFFLALVRCKYWLFLRFYPSENRIFLNFLPVALKF